MKISREVRVGFFVVLVVAAFVWVYGFLKGRNILSTVAEYNVIYDKVNGLTESNPVLVNGFKVGQVSHVGFTDDHSGRLLVKIWMEEDFKIPKNSVAQIYSADLMGSKAIRLLLSNSQEYQHTGDTLKSDLEGSLQEQVSIEMLPLKHKAENLLLSIDSVMAVIQTTFNEDFRENFAVSFQKIRSIIASLNRSVLTLDTLITNEDGSISQILEDTETLTANLKDHNKDIGNTLANLSALSDSLASSDIKGTIASLSQTLNQMNQLLAGINQGQGTLGQLATNDSLYNNLEGLTRELELLLADLKANPKRYVQFSLIDFTLDKPKEPDPSR